MSKAVLDGTFGFTRVASTKAPPPGPISTSLPGHNAEKRGSVVSVLGFMSPSADGSRQNDPEPYVVFQVLTDASHRNEPREREGLLRRKHFA
eukprot:3278105-Rhodomonas_salina.1